MRQAVVTKEQLASRFEPVLREIESKEGRGGREGEREGEKRQNEGRMRERERERERERGLIINRDTGPLTRNSVITAALLLMYSTVSLTKIMSK